MVHLYSIIPYRHNEMWGKKAPSRLRPLQVSRKLFHSEPNLLDHLPDLPPAIEPDLSLLPEEEDVENPDTPPASNWASHSHHHSLAVFPPNRSVPVDKCENIRSFLASLPPIITIDDDQGIGENLYNSESGSGFSTPNLSPTDDEQFNLRFNKLGKEISRRNRSGSLDSSPKIGEEENEKQIEVDEEKPSASFYVPSVKTEGQASSEDQAQENTRKQTLTVPPKPAAPAEPKPRAASCDGLVANVTLERRQRIAVHEKIPFTIKTVGIESTGLVMNREPSSMSPNVSFSSNSASLSSWLPSQSEDMGQNQPVVAEENIATEVNDDTMKPVEARFHLGGTEPETRSESPFEEPTSPVCHRRVKSDTLNMSGLIKSPQIQSVPERVKEIEQLNSKSLKNENMKMDSQPMHIDDKPTLEMIDFQPTAVPQFISRNSSVNSLLSCASGMSCSCEDELEQFEQVPIESSSPPQLLTTRHESLSPSPPSISKVSEHVRHSSLCNMPCAQPRVDPEARSESTSASQSNPTTLGEPVTPPLVGAVKARVLHIEEKAVRKCSNTSEKIDTSSLLRSLSPVRIKRLSNQLPQRPASVAVDGTEISSVGLATASSHSNVDPGYSPDLRTQPRMSRRESTPPAVFSAWCNWISAEDIPPPPVQDLKRKFEESRSLRRSQSLRTVESPKKMSRRAGTSSPDQRSRLQHRYTKH